MNDDLNSVIRDLSGAGQWVGLQAGKLVGRSGDRVRDEARRLAPRTRLPHYANKITAETRHVGHVVEAEIGPEKGGQGNLGHILEYGTAKSPPHAHLGPALDREAPDFVAYLAKLLDPFRR